MTLTSLSLPSQCDCCTREIPRIQEFLADLREQLLLIQAQTQSNTLRINALINVLSDKSHDQAAVISRLLD